jgi:hypothetical protein
MTARKKTVSTTWSMRCPQCRSDTEIDICASVWVRLCPNGTDVSLAAVGDHEWDDDCRAMCGCGHHGHVRDFRMAGA